jgi:uncharacterized protein (DUF697 family)
MARLAALKLLSVVREVRAGAGGSRPLVVGGARGLAFGLAKELRAGGEAAAVLEHGAADQAAALIWIGAAEEDVLRTASRAGVPIVGITEGESLPYVLDTELVRLRPGRGFPVDQIARVLARVLGTDGAALAARLPVLREAVVDELIRRSARKNALVAAAVFVPGVDMPVLTLNQVRLVLRIAIAYGYEVDQTRLPDVLAVVGAGFGLRSVARELLDLVPGAGWAAKGAVAYAGTRAVGEAARRRFGAGAAGPAAPAA